MMKPATLLRIRTRLCDRDLVLDAVHPLGHLEIERGRRAPADRRCDDDGVGPVHQGLVDAVELVARVHLGDRAGPGAGLRRLRIVTLAGAELEIVEPNEPRLGAELGGRLERMVEQMVGAREARIGLIHHGRRDAGETQRPRRTLGLARERTENVTLIVRTSKPKMAGGHVSPSPIQGPRDDLGEALVARGSGRYLIR